MRRCRGMEPIAAVGIEAIPTITKQVVCRSHARHYLGIDHTCSILKKESGNIKVDRHLVENVVAACEKCRSIDLAPIRWRLEVWQWTLFGTD